MIGFVWVMFLCCFYWDDCGLMIIKKDEKNCLCFECFKLDKKNIRGDYFMIILFFLLK